MIVKNILLASIFTLCIPVTAQAQNVQNNTESYENRKVSCDSSNQAECDAYQEQRQRRIDNQVDSREQQIDNGVDNLDNEVDNQVDNLDNGVDNLDNEIDNEEVPQRTRRTRRASTEKIKSYYAGFSGGVFIPDGGLNLGFGGSVFGGGMFTENIGADLEFLVAFGGLDDGDFNNVSNVDGNYSLLGFYLNPRYEIPFADNYKAFISPGIGLLRTNINIDDGPGSNLDGGDTDFDVQVKGGLTFPIGESNEGFGQVRLVDFDTVSLEAGMKFGF
jgi:hypothetical protein